MKNRLKKALAFTITELVIVIAVIAILAAVLIPTFSHVIDESKKSHDTQYMREINTAIANYAAQHDQTYPAEYEDLMLALNDMGLCDPSNPFLLATALKQDNTYLMWRPGTDQVILVTTDEGSLVNLPRGMGNFFQLTSGSVTSAQEGYYLLCNSGDADSMFIADLYRDYYITAGGNINSFLQKNAEKLKDLSGKMENKSWANSVVDSFKNATQGYTYDGNMAENLLTDLKGTTSAQVDLSDLLPESEKNTDFAHLPETSQAVIQQGVRASLATLASLENDSATKEQLSNKKVTLDVPEGTVVDMQEVTITPIGNSYRKEEDVKTGTPKSTVSVDYGNVTLQNLEIPENTFISTGAEHQSQDDSGHPGGGYAFTYGLFGTVIAAPDETVTIENLKIKNVRMNFSGATEDLITGNKVNTFADNAGVVVGYAQGNVILRNIEIDGANEKNEIGLIKGYDAISGVVGRAYGVVKPVPDGKGGMKDAYNDASLTLDHVSVKNLQIQGERRAAGFVGFVSNSMNHITISNCSLENVDISCERNDSGTEIYQCWAMTFIMGSGNDIRIENNTLTNVKTRVDFFGEYLDAIGNKDTNSAQKAPDGTSNTYHAISLAKYVYAENLMLSATGAAETPPETVVQDIY